MIFTPDIKQDTLQAKNFTAKDTFSLGSGPSSLTNISQFNKLSSSEKTIPLVFTDSTLVCNRNSIKDFTFTDSNYVDFVSEINTLNKFPFVFTGKNKKLQEETWASVTKHLKEGEELPQQSFKSDWNTGIILLAAFLFSIVSNNSKNLLHGVARFFLFRGINDPSSRDIGGLFHWQSTLINFISFLVISLFAYSALEFSDLIPLKTNGILIWIIILVIIILAVTLRHIVSIITGNASGQIEAFREYLLAVYLSYRFSAVFLVVFIIMVSYTSIFSATTWYNLGIMMLVMVYLIRLTRLLVIFLNRKISIFYLILYLCALEILPVLITFKYFTGVI